jgi:hypothetical protein
MIRRLPAAGLAALLVVSVGATIATASEAASDRAIARTLVLRRSDAGPGYKLFTAGTSTTSSFGPCRPGVTSRNRTARADGELIATATVNALLSEAALYATAADAQRAFAVQGAFLACLARHLPGRTERDKVGGVPPSYVTYHFLSVSHPSYTGLHADESVTLGFDSTLTENGRKHAYDGQVVYLRRGRAVVQLLVIAGSHAEVSTLAGPLVAALDGRAAAAPL